MQINAKVNYSVKTHEGGQAQVLNPTEQLRRSIMACMLFENTFYESGIEIAERISKLIPLVDPKDCVRIALDAAEKMHLRHAPLLIVREMVRYVSHRKYVSRTLQRIITRPDQMADFLALYWKEGKKPIAHKVKQGLSFCMKKFNEYQFAKNLHNDRAVKLRDVMFLTHPKPEGEEQEALFKRLANNELITPDTWEVALSSGADKKETFERLINDKKLGALAFIRNIRNMVQANVSQELMNNYGLSLDLSKIFPWQFIASAKVNPQQEPLIESMMLKSLEGHEKLKGKTIILVDVSGSMSDKMSAKSEMTRLDAACGLAIILREICNEMIVMTFSNKLVQCPPRHGFALRDAILNSQPHGGTELGHAIQLINNNCTYDRIIVLTDEQSHDGIANPKTKLAYIMNIATYKNAVDYSHWKHISGFSAGVIDWIFEFEKNYR